MLSGIQRNTPKNATATTISLRSKMTDRVVHIGMGAARVLTHRAYMTAAKIACERTTCQYEHGLSVEEKDPHLSPLQVAQDSQAARGRRPAQLEWST